MTGPLTGTVTRDSDATEGKGSRDAFQDSHDPPIGTAGRQPLELTTY